MGEEMMRERESKREQHGSSSAAWIMLKVDYVRGRVKR